MSKCTATNMFKQMINESNPELMVTTPEKKLLTKGILVLQDIKRTLENIELKYRHPTEVSLEHNDSKIIRISLSWDKYCIEIFDESESMEFDHETITIDNLVAELWRYQTPSTTACWFDLDTSCPNEYQGWLEEMFENLY